MESTWEAHQPLKASPLLLNLSQGPPVHHREQCLINDIHNQLSPAFLIPKWAVGREPKIRWKWKIDTKLNLPMSFPPCFTAHSQTSTCYALPPTVSITSLPLLSILSHSTHHLPPLPPKRHLSPITSTLSTLQHFKILLLCTYLIKVAMDNSGWHSIARAQWHVHTSMYSLHHASLLAIVLRESEYVGGRSCLLYMPAS